MIVKKINQDDRETYNECAKAYGTVFNSLEWLSIFGEAIQVYGLYDNKGNIVGGFHLFNKRKYGLTIFCNSPFTPFMGPFIRIDVQNPVKIMNTWKEALAAVSDFIDKLSYSIISFDLSAAVVDTQPFIWKKFKVVPNYTYLVDLSMPVEGILKNMSSNRRNDINKGTKDGLSVRKIEDLEIIDQLVAKTFSRQGMRHNEFHQRKVLFEFANNDCSFAFAAFKGDTPIACTFCIYDKRRVYALLGGYDHENKNDVAGVLCLWEAIKYSKGLGLSYFDFEGSMVPRIERYYREFGGTLTPYYRINKAKLPIEILLKIYKRELF